MAPEVGGSLWMLPYKKVDDPRDKVRLCSPCNRNLQILQSFVPTRVIWNQRQRLSRQSETYVFNELRAQAKTSLLSMDGTGEEEESFKENEEIIALVLKIAQLRYPYNQSKISNVYKAEGRLQEVRNMILMNDNQIIQKNILLNQLMNVPGDVRFSIDTLGQPREFILAVADTITFTESRSDIRRIDKNILAMKLNRGRWKTINRNQIST